MKQYYKIKQNIFFLSLAIVFITSASVRLIPGKTNSACDSLVVTADPIWCYGSPTTLHVQVIGGVPPYSYSWMPSIGLSDPTVANPVVNPAITTTYTVTVTDSMGCVNSGTVTLTVPQICDCIPWPPITVCQSQSATLQPYDCVCVTGTWISYQWSTGAITPTITVSMPGRYTVIITDVKGCTASEMFDVTGNTSPAITITSNSPVCIGNNITMTASATNAYSYSWLGGPSGSSYSVTPGAAGSYKYYVTVTNLDGCSATDSTTVTVYPLPTIITTPDSKICKNRSITLSASGGVSYLWSTLQTTNKIMVTPAASGVNLYSVVVTDAHNCSNTKTIKITVDPSCVPYDGGGYQPD